MRPPTAAHTTIVIEKVRSMKVGEANSDDDHVEHSGEPGDRRRNHEEEDLVERRRRSRDSGRGSVIPGRLQDQARAGLDQQTRTDERPSDSATATR